MSFVVLSRGTRTFHPIITAARANRCHPVLQHLFRRDYSVTTANRTNAANVKMFEDRIRKTNADNSLSAEYRYRASVRLFAMIDQAKIHMKMMALFHKTAPIHLRPSVYFKRQSVKASRDRDDAQMRNFLLEERIAIRELARLRWMVFKLTVFAPPGDVAVWERLIRVPIFVLQMVGSTVSWGMNRMGMVVFRQVNFRD
jgi:hypothetical protein